MNPTHDASQQRNNVFNDRGLVRLVLTQGGKYPRSTLRLDGRFSEVSGAEVEVDFGSVLLFKLASECEEFLDETSFFFSPSMAEILAL